MGACTLANEPAKCPWGALFHHNLLLLTDQRDKVAQRDRHARRTCCPRRQGWGRACLDVIVPVLRKERHEEGLDGLAAVQRALRPDLQPAAAMHASMTSLLLSSFQHQSNFACSLASTASLLHHSERHAGAGV